MKCAGKARNNGLYRHIRTSKEIIRNLLNYSYDTSLMKSNDSSKAPLPRICGGGALYLIICFTIFCLDITIHLEIWETISYRENKLCRLQ